MIIANLTSHEDIAVKNIRLRGVPDGNAEIVDVMNSPGIPLLGSMWPYPADSVLIADSRKVTYLGDGVFEIEVQYQ